jgi:tetratricopeptide (TPR) repeat protein
VEQAIRPRASQSYKLLEASADQERGAVKSFLSLAVIALYPFLTIAQSNQPIKRTDTVTVSAGISKEQLELEGRLDVIISNGDESLKSGDTAGAVKHYESALELVHKQPLLAEQENRVLSKLANGYIQDNRAKDAISIYSKFLAAKEKECEPGSNAAGSCADAQYDLGVAKLHAGDWEGALEMLKQAEVNFGIAQKQSDFHESVMIYINEQAQTEAYIGAVLFHLGKKTEGIAVVEAGVAKLTQVQEDAMINPGIRESAGKVLRSARMMLVTMKATE